MEASVETLAHCTRCLGSVYDATTALDEGHLLFQSLSMDRKLCEKVSEKLPRFEQLLLAAQNAYGDLPAFIQTGSAALVSALPELKARVEEWSNQAVAAALKELKDFLHGLDSKLEEVERAFGQLESWSRSVDMACVKHRRAKTTAGGVFLASGCLALTLSAATFLIKCLVQTTGGTMSPAAAVLFRFSPLNTALAGGIVTVLGISDARHSQRYSKLTLDFRDFADDLQKELTNSRAFRTRIQRLCHAVEDVMLKMHVAAGVGKMRSEVWRLLLEWLSVYEQGLKSISPTTVS